MVPSLAGSVAWGASVFGGFSIGGAGGANERNLDNGKGGDVYNNTVILTNVILYGGMGGDGGSSSGGGAGHGGIGGGSVIGGASFGGPASNGFTLIEIVNINGTSGGSVSNNVITLTNVTLFGGTAGHGGKNLTGNPTGFGRDGLTGGSVVGGLSVGGSGSMFSEKVGDGGDTTGNSIKISGHSLIWGSIYGGYSLAGQNAEGVELDEPGHGGKTTDNIITLEGSNIKIGERDESGNVTSYGSIWGGRSVNYDGSENNDFDKVVSGNTLNLVGYRGTVAGIYNFENYNWILPNDIRNGDVFVKIAAGGTAVDLTNTKHTVAMYNDGSRLNNGDVITMIDKTAGSLGEKNYRINQGSFIVYDAILKQQTEGDKALVLTIQNKTSTGEAGGDNGNNNPTTDNGGHSAAKLNPQSKSYAEGRAAALGLVGQGSDLIAVAGIDKIRILVRSSEDKITQYNVIPFMIANGASQRYKTGSHFDVDGFNMAVGLATGFEFSAGHKATIGALFEYGRGTYDTYNSFTNFASVDGDGDTDYKGGGIFGRVDFAGTGLGYVKNLAADQADGLYVEASLRAGRASSKFDVGRNADVLGNFTGVYRGSYDSDVTYFGGHVAGGYVLNFDDKQSVDVYGRYLWTHTDSDNVSVGYEKLNLDSSLSSRIQIGGRYSYAYSDLFKPYIGAAYEYEFDGEVKAKTYEFNLNRPSLEGSTGIFEAGFSLIPLPSNKALNLNVNGQGYVGQRQGGGGGIEIKYEF
ncbi:autotransporter outer membrane beta-barrel domain-containing protein [uncultured Bartonella sp.]|uniref:autotransporter outer membrane beta-barrel domain-containing protein n=1 Tax=uncultured Bartonella sp. TaxID=104108 RepID=UPI002601D9A5|nr:autotransporter outer membrane beta-barrel domain-containing protein [uncultured Bartonella sp.]